MHGIEVRKSDAGPLVELWGELDIFCIEELKGVLTYVKEGGRGWPKQQGKAPAG